MDDNSKPVGDDSVANPSDSDNRIMSSDDSVEIVVVDAGDSGVESESNSTSLSRPSSSPVTDLNQVEGDHALASTLQEQEEADMTVRMTNDGSDNGNSEDGSHNHDDEYDDDDYHDLDDDQYDDEFEDDDSEDLMDDDDDHGEDLIDDDDEEGEKDEDKDKDEDERMSGYDSNGFPDEHTIMRDLENWNGRWPMDDMELSSEALEMDYYDHYYGDHSQPQDTLEEGYSDEIYYEDYIGFGDLRGTDICGVSPELLQFLPTDIYSLDKGLGGKPDPCVICQSDYEDDESITPLPCKHSYHSKCITTWLKIKGVCPICNAEVLGSDAWHIANELSLL